MKLKLVGSAVILVLIHFSYSSEIRAESEGFSSEFSSGVKAYQDKDFVQAKTHFLESAKLSPTNADVYYNLGLSEFQLNQKGAAIGYWRRALDLKPTHSLAQDSIKFAATQMLRPIGNQNASLFEKLGDLLKYISLHLLLFFTLAFTFAGCWTWIKILGKRKVERREERDLTAFGIKAPALGFGAFLFLALSLAKYIDKHQIGATIVVPTVTLRSSPSDESANLMEVFEGQEVVVRKSRDNWIQVQVLGRSTGWLPRNAVLISSGSIL